MLLCLYLPCPFSFSYLVPESRSLLSHDASFSSCIPSVHLPNIPSLSLINLRTDTIRAPYFSDVSTLPCHSHTRGITFYTYAHLYRCFTLALLTLLSVGRCLYVLSHLFIFRSCLVTDNTSLPVSPGTWRSSGPEAVRTLAQNEPRMCSPISQRPSDTQSRLPCLCVRVSLYFTHVLPDFDVRIEAETTLQMHVQNTYRHRVSLTLRDLLSHRSSPWRTWLYLGDVSKCGDFSVTCFLIFSMPCYWYLYYHLQYLYTSLYKHHLEIIIKILQY